MGRLDSPYLHLIARLNQATEVIATCHQDMLQARLQYPEWIQLKRELHKQIHTLERMANRMANLDIDPYEGGIDGWAE